MKTFEFGQMLSVREVGEILGVSQSTVRRDLYV